MLHFIAALALVSCVSSQSYNTTCKPVFRSPDWPSAPVWNRLNTTVSGRLIAPTPPGAVCHADRPQYNEFCTLLAAQWTNISFHAINPVSADYNDVTCIPDNEHPCSSLGYPRYVAQAINARDVQQAVSFAARTGVRLIVEGTGHDFISRLVSPPHRRLLCSVDFPQILPLRFPFDPHPQHQRTRTQRQ
jgi:hypothetical protein